jgi:hypothetical protein
VVKRGNTIPGLFGRIEDSPRTSWYVESTHHPSAGADHAAHMDRSSTGTCHARSVAIATDVIMHARECRSPRAHPALFFDAPVARTPISATAMAVGRCTRPNVNDCRFLVWLHKFIQLIIRVICCRRTNPLCIAVRVRGQCDILCRYV